MAIPGIGYRTANDVLLEIGFHLCSPNVITALTANVATGVQTAAVGTTNAMYIGALVVVDANTVNAEVVTVTAVVDATHFTGDFANAHSSGASVSAATFPTQQPTDPIFTQTEMLGYLSRAQNEFLTAVPSYFAFFQQNVVVGQIFQTTPSTAIQIERIAASPFQQSITSLTRSGNVVTAVFPYPHGLVQYNTFMVVNALNTSFDGVFAVASVPSPTTFTYIQVGANAATTGGYIESMLRLYELTQEELSQQNRSWRYDSAGPLQNWFEDRSGLYGWGTGGLPSSNFPVELLCAVRDKDMLSLLDGFLVPDLCLHGVKYLTLNYIWSKNGIQQQPQMAEWALKRYAQVVMATQRWIEQMRMGTR